MKIILLFLFLFILSACGSGAEPFVPELPEGDYAVITPYDNIISFDDNAGTQGGNKVELPPPMALSWGYNTRHLEIDFSMSDPDFINKRGQVFEYLNNKFNISLSGYIYDRSHTIKARHKTPDTALANPYLEYLDGQTRSIPREMIERYAPDYAYFLTEYGGWDINKTEEGVYLGLTTFDVHNENLNIFSLYRLDWLEAMGIQPKGALVQLDEDVFFTPEAFNKDEFFHVMRVISGISTGFSSTKTPKGWSGSAMSEAFGLSVNILLPFLFKEITPILGMHGVYSSVIEDNGKAVPFFASSQYKSALSFIESIAGENGIFIYGGNDALHTGFITSQIVGWTNVELKNIYDVCQKFLLYAKDLSYDKNAKLLITPPETDLYGQCGVGAVQNTTIFTPERSWVIGRHVDDEKLARILQVFNALSFDPETYITARYGIEGVHYNWEGEPYHSAVIPDRSGYMSEWGYQRNVYPMNDGAEIFVTDVADGRNVKQIYTQGYKSLFDYAESGKGRSAVSQPFKHEVWGKRTDIKAQLDANYAAGINTLVKNFLSRVLNGANVDSEWNNYISDLNELGLEFYTDFYNAP